MFGIHGDDLLLNLISEGIGMVVSVIIISPLVSWIIARKQAANQRNERIKMSAPLRESYKEVHSMLLQIAKGRDADFITGGLEMVRRKINREIKDGPFNPSYEMALGNPDYILRTIRQKIETQVRYINSLIDLFAPHFRTQDAYLAARYLEHLKSPSDDLNRVLQDMEWILASAQSFENMAAAYQTTEATKENGGAEGAGLRQNIIRQAQEKITSAIRNATQTCSSMSAQAEKTEQSLNDFIHSLESAK